MLDISAQLDVFFLTYAKIMFNNLCKKKPGSRLRHCSAKLTVSEMAFFSTLICVTIFHGHPPE